MQEQVRLENKINIKDSLKMFKLEILQLLEAKMSPLINLPDKKYFVSLQDFKKFSQEFNQLSTKVDQEMVTLMEGY